MSYSIDKSQDMKLIREIQRGRPELFNVLVEKYQPRIIQLSIHFVADPSEAKDISQETFIRAYRGLGHFKGDSSFYTWLYRIGINTAKNYLKSKQLQSARHPQSLDDLEHWNERPLFEESETPEQMIAGEELEAVIFDSIDHMPADLKATLTLREIGGLSYEDIADLLDCPVGTIRSRLHRARHLINVAMAEEPLPEPIYRKKD